MTKKRAIYQHKGRRKTDESVRVRAVEALVRCGRFARAAARGRERAEGVRGGEVAATAAAAAVCSARVKGLQQRRRGVQDRRRTSVVGYEGAGASREQGIFQTSVVEVRCFTGSGKGV